MAKEKDSTRALTGSRLLNLPVPSTIVERDFENNYTATNGWQTLAGQLAYFENYFDLSAYELDDLTLVPTALTLQDGLPYTTSSQQPTFNLAVFDIISQEKLSMAEVFTNYTTTYDYPSSPASKQDWSQLLMCGFRLMTPQTDFSNINLLLPATGGSLGSSEPTAVQKLWVYRVVIPSADDLSGVRVVVPATRFALGAEIVKEEDLPYMMRLKRSYELATQG